MAKSVFRPNELKTKEDKVILKLTRDFAPPVEDVPEEKDEYTGPTADDLRREAELFKKQWEEEKSQMLAAAQAKADEIVKNAETAAFAQVKHQTDKAQIIKNEADKTAQEIIRKAQEEAQQILAQARMDEQKLYSESKRNGYDEGHEAGYQDGAEEAHRLVSRLHTIIEGVQAKRQEILESTESQIVELVLLMTRKVVKILSENQKSVLLSNVVQALKKVKGRGDVTIRVNMDDVKLTTEHISQFIREVENVKSITVLEDSTVQRGGCIIETDFGAIDARIQSQLGELETKLLEVAPIKTKNKSDVLNPDI